MPDTVHMKMTSNRPYLIRAFYDWIVDNECTPYMAVNAFFPGVEVPQEHVSDGQMVGVQMCGLWNAPGC